MIITEVYGLPKLSQKKLRSLYEKMFLVLKNTPELCLFNERKTIILFPPDKLQWGLGLDILVKIEDLPSKLEFGICKSLHSNIVKTIREIVPTTCVVCKLHFFSNLENLEFTSHYARCNYGPTEY